MEWTEDGRADEGKRNQKYTTRLSRAQPNMSKKEEQQQKKDYVHSAGRKEILEHQKGQTLLCVVELWQLFAANKWSTDIPKSIKEL